MDKKAGNQDGGRWGGEGQGRHAKAEPLIRRSLAILEKRPGPAHPNIIKTLNNLAWIYEKLGKREEAAALHARSRTILERLRKRR